MSILELLLRIGTAIIIGTAIGVERERKNRPAGMRTHVLVCLGACMIAILESYIVQDVAKSFPDASGISVSVGRIAAQVVSGIGFLGAGTIFTARKKIAGLTTAASLWNVACLGLLAGFGYYWVASLGCILVIIVLLVLQKIVRIPLIKKMEIKFIHRVETIDFFNQYFEETGIEVLEVDFHVENREPNNLYTNVYELDMPSGITYRDIVTRLSEHKNVQSIRTINI